MASVRTTRNIDYYSGLLALTMISTYEDIKPIKSNHSVKDLLVHFPSILILPLWTRKSSLFWQLPLPLGGLFW